MKIVLIVDDDPLVLRLVSKRLSRKGNIRVLTAETGKAGLEILEKETPHVIILDHFLPDTDGVTLCKTIKSNPKFATVPTLFFTSFQDFGFEASTEAAGAICVINKNHLNELMTGVFKWMDKQHIREEA